MIQLMGLGTGGAPRRGAPQCCSPTFQIPNISKDDGLSLTYLHYSSNYCTRRSFLAEAAPDLDQHEILSRSLLLQTTLLAAKHA